MWLVILFVLLFVTLALRPLRVIYLRHAIFTIPATIGAVLGYFVALAIIPYAPPEFTWITPVNMLIWGGGFGEQTGRYLRGLPR